MKRWKIKKQSSSDYINERTILNDDDIAMGVWRDEMAHHTEANAEFIVRAVNNHEDLLNALKWVRDEGPVDTSRMLEYVENVIRKVEGKV